MLIKAILFDFDGTLTEPDSLDFAAIRKAIGCPDGQPILEYIQTIPSPSSRKDACDILDRFEAEAAGRSRPNAGAEELIVFIRSRGLKLGIVTRNSIASVRRALDNFSRISLPDFDVILSRDDAFLPKPSPEAVLEAARRLNISPSEILVVGDFVFDIEAGYRAGARTVLLTNRRLSHRCEHAPDYTIHELPELKEIIDDTTPLPDGKLPNWLLGRFLRELKLGDSSLLIPPGVGEDIAAVRLQGEEVLVLKSDPVTFASDRIGYYAVSVNVNDVATSGAAPRWLLATLLFPSGTCSRQVRHVMLELNQVARCHGLVICGGHTEITDAVNRAVVVAQVAGTVRSGRLIDKRGMKTQDCVLLTKGVAVEGTCIIAREFPSVLRSLGLSEADLEASRRLLDSPGISVVREAAIAAESGKVTAMHDVTEGGVATALEELSAAGNHRIRVFPERIPVLKETAVICDLLGINPLGLIGSGSLLIVCGPDACDMLLEKVRLAGIEATHIGEVLEEGVGIEAAGPNEWPRFAVDEIARVFQQLQSAVGSGQ
jgi:HAD superfamily hydrolase (TIGR01509 family)